MTQPPNTDTHSHEKRQVLDHLIVEAYLDAQRHAFPAQSHGDGGDRQSEHAEDARVQEVERLRQGLTVEGSDSGVRGAKQHTIVTQNGLKH